jgi:polar amino acid transport system substrate-binding protein
VLGIAFAVLAATACAPEDEEGGSTSDDTSAAPTDDASSAADECAVDQLNLTTPGTLTVGTDSPAFPPWFENDDPTNGKGYESAVAYAVAEQMGFTKDQVTWVTVPFNKSYAPGPKDFDFDINQISITPERAEAVTFSQGYYTASQAVIVQKDSDLAGVSSLAELKDAKLGAQIGTTSLTAAEDVIQPSSQVAVFDDTNAAKQALVNGQVDAIIADLPTAFYITAVEIPSATIAGQFESATDAEEFGLLFEKDNPLVTCVDAAITALKDDGTLDQIEQQWLSDTVSVPVLS